MVDFNSPFAPQEYQVLYIEVNGNLLDQVQSINIVRTDGGADVETLARDWAGRVKGAAKADVTVRGVIPYKTADVGGEGFSSAGMQAGAGQGPGGGYPATQLDQTILTGSNTTSALPVKFTVLIGNTPAQQLMFFGYIHTLTIDSAVGKQADFTFQASGQFATFG